MPPPTGTPPPQPPPDPAPRIAARRPCVIFNPTARGDKARAFRQFLDSAASETLLKPTTGPGTARRLARQAVEDGHDLIVAAGGDGTAFEVLNGMADAPEGLTRAALGVLPLGTANVLAHELRIPLHPRRAWELLRHGRLRTMDCGYAEFRDPAGAPQHAHFAIVAGAGLDARAVQLVDWSLKKRTGKLAYIAAAFRALLRYPDQIRCTLAGQPFRGRVVLAGNGRLYAGDLAVFGDGALDSGHLHVRGVPRISPFLLLGCLRAYATHRWPFEGRLPADSVTDLALDSDAPAPLQLDGEFAGWLPARLRILPRALHVLVPSAD